MYTGHIWPSQTPCLPILQHLKSGHLLSKGLQIRPVENPFSFLGWRSVGNGRCWLPGLAGYEWKRRGTPLHCYHAGSSCLLQCGARRANCTFRHIIFYILPTKGVTSFGGREGVKLAAFPSLLLAVQRGMCSIAEDQSLPVDLNGT